MLTNINPLRDAIHRVLHANNIISITYKNSIRARGEYIRATARVPPTSFVKIRQKDFIPKPGILLHRANCNSPLRYFISLKRLCVLTPSDTSPPSGEVLLRIYSVYPWKFVFWTNFLQYGFQIENILVLLLYEDPGQENHFVLRSAISKSTNSVTNLVFRIF
jgi:hypothetical protein